MEWICLLEIIDHVDGAAQGASEEYDCTDTTQSTTIV